MVKIVEIPLMKMLRFHQSLQKNCFGTGSRTDASGRGISDDAESVIARILYTIVQMSEMEKEYYGMEVNPYNDIRAVLDKMERGELKVSVSTTKNQFEKLLEQYRNGKEAN